MPHVGIERLDMTYLAKRGILVTNARGSLGMPIAEDIFSQMLMLARAPAYFRHQAAHRWQHETGPCNLSGKTLAIVGTGDIGRETAKRAQAMTMRVLGLNTSGQSVDGFEQVFASDALHSLLPIADYLVLACPLAEKTEGMIGARELAMMKPSAVVINIARGALMDEEALLAALTSGALYGAGLKVFVDEFAQGRLVPESPFWDLPNVIITPHQAGDGDQFYQHFSRIFWLMPRNLFKETSMP